MSSAAAALSCLTLGNCTATFNETGQVADNATAPDVRYVNERTDTNASSDVSGIPVAVFDANGMAIYSYTFIIVILSIAVVFAIFFTMCRLVTKAEAHKKALDGESGMMFGSSQDEF